MLLYKYLGGFASTNANVYAWCDCVLADAYTLEIVQCRRGVGGAFCCDRVYALSALDRIVHSLEAWECYGVC